MDLTDKIDLEGWYLEEDNIADKQINEYMKNTADYILQEVTPKVAIDFANWVVNSRYIAIRYSNEFTDYNANLYTPEQLFEEFLKDYNYEG